MPVLSSIKGKVLGKDDELKKLKKENEELCKMLRESRPGLLTDRVRALVALKGAYHAQVRKSMEDIVDTAPERLLNKIHSNSTLNKAEAFGKALVYDKGADTIGALESNIHWGSKWKPLGQTMEVPDSNPPSELTVEFGKNMRLLYFELSENYLNAASYGATPRPVMEARAQWDKANQRNPVLWRFKMLPLRLRQAEQRLAAAIGADPSDTKIVLNANAATSGVLKALPWEAGDRMMIFSVDYDATKHACQWLTRNKGVEIVELDLPLPMSDDEILSRARDSLERMATGGDCPLPRLANFCHVTSKSAWIFPAKKLTKLFHSYGVSVMIDGAQAAGHLDINIGGIGADWYVGTVHKWMYSCQGVAFLVTQPHKYACTFPLTISYFDGKGYAKEFSYYGLQDFSTWCSVIDALDFAEKACGGFANIRRYCRSQAVRCVDILRRAWGTEPVQGTPETYGNMPIMPLPDGHGAEDSAAGKVMGYLLTRHNITAFLLVHVFGGVPTLCVRCTCQIYTDDDDWERLAAAVNALGGKYSTLKVIAELGFLPDSVSAMLS
ncbi:putative L-cysteine desulfhydrase 1 [Diplonema papillatum]|nr:putative L-cysteine desulfhydrase 1 [Diplonema papillatum]|eukprot:gene4736-7280_t